MATQPKTRLCYALLLALANPLSDPPCEQRLAHSHQPNRRAHSRRHHLLHLRAGAISLLLALPSRCHAARGAAAGQIYRVLPVYMRARLLATASRAPALAGAPPRAPRPTLSSSVGQSGFRRVDAQTLRRLSPAARNAKASSKAPCAPREFCILDGHRVRAEPTVGAQTSEKLCGPSHGGSMAWAGAGARRRARCIGRPGITAAATAFIPLPRIGRGMAQRRDRATTADALPVHLI